MTERGVTRRLAPQVKLGTDISVQAGGGASAGTAGPSADLIGVSMAKGERHRRPGAVTNPLAKALLEKVAYRTP